MNSRRKNPDEIRAETERIKQQINREIEGVHLFDDRFDNRRERQPARATIQERVHELRDYQRAHPLPRNAPSRRASQEQDLTRTLLIGAGLIAAGLLLGYMTAQKTQTPKRHNRHSRSNEDYRRKVDRTAKMHQRPRSGTSDEYYLIAVEAELR